MVESRAGLHTLVGDPRNLLGSVAPRSNLIGVGPGGVLVGAVIAALLARDFAFYRRARKGHGTRQHLEGRYQEGRPWTIVHCGDGDAGMLRSAGLTVAAEIPVTAVRGTPRRTAFTLPCHKLKPSPQLDLAAEVKLLTGEVFVRSSGELADHYFETLWSAHTHTVATAFASTLPPHLDAVAGVMWGGCYLAAVAAVSGGSRLVLVDPDQLDSAATLGPVIRSVAFVDDLVNSGTDLRRCERLGVTSRTDATFHALYSRHPRVELNQHSVAIAQRLVHR